MFEQKHYKYNLIFIALFLQFKLYQSSGTSQNTQNIHMYRNIQELYIYKVNDSWGWMEPKY